MDIEDTSDPQDTRPLIKSIAQMSIDELVDHMKLKYPLPWRVGTKGKQTPYDASPIGDGGLPGRSLGRMDTPELAAFVVAAVNAQMIGGMTTLNEITLTIRLETDDLQKLVRAKHQAELDAAVPALPESVVSVALERRDIELFVKETVRTALERLP